MSAGILDGFQTIIPTAAAVLSEKRQILRLTQQEVANRAKITLRQYQRLESGERNILTSSFGLACRVIEALDMDVSKFYHGDYCNGVQREHNKKLNNGLPILHKVPPKRDYGRYFCIMAEKGGTSHGGLTEKLSLFFHAKKQEVNA